MQPVTVLVWTCTLVFVATAVITLLALLGLVTLGGGDGSKHHHYLNRLFTVLIIEIVGVAIAVFSVNVGINKNYVQGLQNQLAVSTGSISSEPSFRFNLLGRDTTMVLTIPDSSTGAAMGPPAPPIFRPDDVDEHQGVVQVDTLQASVYATSDGPRHESAIIPIPEGWHYVGHRTRETSRNGDTSFNVELVKADDQIEGVKINVTAENRGLLAPRNWIGMVLEVIIEKKRLDR